MEDGLFEKNWSSDLTKEFEFGKEKAFPKKIINIHPGDVYLYRGRHPLPTAILEGHPCSTVSMHYITDESIDAGPLISQISIAINYKATYQENEAALRKMLYPFVVPQLLSWKSQDGLPSWRWSPNPGSYRKRLSKKTLDHLVNSPNLLDFRQS